MQYRLVKAINNNVVLVNDDASGEQIILMSKGIGFNRRPGDIISDDVKDKQLFKLWNDVKEVNSFDIDREKIESVVKDIVGLASSRLSIQNSGLYPSLLDHIVFAVERLHFALPIDNPFLNEISILYNEEYEVSKIAVSMINDRLNLKMGEAETGYIALHLRSARKNRTVRAYLENVRMYNQVTGALSDSIGESFSAQSGVTRTFLLSLDELVDACKKGMSIEMPGKKKVFKDMAQSFKIAKIIGGIIENELKLHLSDDIIGFITVDIERLRQLHETF